MFYPEDSYDEATLSEISRIPLHSAGRIPTLAPHSVRQIRNVRTFAQVSVSALRKLNI
jgi:hypothetical protein